MQRYFCSILLASLFLFPGTLVSQDAVKALDRVYGLDQTLCNGKTYSTFLPYGTKGNQYLISPEYVTGSVTIKGIRYDGISLNYDIHSQQVVLKYRDESGSMRIIEVSKAWLTDFSLGPRNFEYLTLEQEPRIYQVLGRSPLRILYAWQKTLDLDIAIGSSAFVFSNASRHAFVLMDGKLRPFRSKGSLLRIFDAASRQEIKIYLRKNKIRMKKFSDQAMADMITFIGNLR